VTQPQDPRKQPLQDDEIALARVLRALPAGEPSSRIDAAILAAASDAVAAAPGERTLARKPRRVLPWLPTWAIGSAAAAVLAIGIGVQLRPPLAPTASAPSEKAEAHRPLPEARPRMSIELPEPEFTAPPPPPPAPVMAPPPPPAPVADAFPAPAPAPVAAEAPTAASDALDSITVTGTRLPAPPAEVDDTARRRDQAAYARQAEERALAAERAREAPAAGAGPVALPPPSADAQLAVPEWFERIRARRDGGDLDGARESLATLQRTHPGVVLPDDLADLR